MRASASAPARHLRLRSILGWYHISNQPLRSASSISMRGRGSELIELTSERRSSSPSFSIGPGPAPGLVRRIVGCHQGLSHVCGTVF